MDRVFLDANVLFSAAYRNQSRLRTLWSLTSTQLITSNHAVLEAQRNLPPDKQDRLLELLAHVEVIDAMADQRIMPPDVELDEKDRPILLSAISGRATHLLTGDLRHFRELFGRTVSGVKIMQPAEYLARHQP